MPLDASTILVALPIILAAIKGYRARFLKDKHFGYLIKPLATGTQISVMISYALGFFSAFSYLEKLYAREGLQYQVEGNTVLLVLVVMLLYTGVLIAVISKFESYTFNYFEERYGEEKSD